MRTTTTTPTTTHHTIRTRVLTTVGALALASATLGACTDHSRADDSAYCAGLRADKPYFQSLDSQHPDLTKLDEAFHRMHTLAGAAPDAVAPDWKTLDDAIGTVTRAMDDAGVDFADLEAMQRGELPPDVDLDAVAALDPAFRTLSGAEVDAAAANIDEHAQDECGIDLAAA